MLDYQGFSSRNLTELTGLSCKTPDHVFKLQQQKRLTFQYWKNTLFQLGVKDQLLVLVHVRVADARINIVAIRINTENSFFFHQRNEIINGLFVYALRVF